MESWRKTRLLNWYLRRMEACIRQREKYGLRCSYSSPPPPPPPPPWSGSGLDSKIAVFGFLFLCLNVLLFDYLAATDPLKLFRLAHEDSWIESLTVVFLLLAGLLLFATAWVESNLFRRCLYILGGIAMVFIAGEEISWGQRIFEFTTPEFLRGLNRQDEFNVHNAINLPLVNKVFHQAIMLLCAVTCVAFFCRKRTVLGIPVPSIPLMFGFLVTIDSVTPYHGPVGLEAVLAPGYLLSSPKTLFLLFVIYALLFRHTRLFIVTVATVTLTLASEFIFMSNYLRGLSEVKEYLFGLAYFLYSLELWLAQGVQGRLTAIFGLKWPNVRGPSLLTTCSLVIAGSTGLMFFEYFSSAHRSIYQSITQGTAGEPVVRSNFDVYLIEDRLIYFKEPCTPADTKPGFFLHIIPADPHDLPGYQKPHGFDNLDFKFYRLHPDLRHCMMAIQLPDYDINSVKTGQFVRGEGWIWKEEFTLNRQTKVKPIK